MTSQDSPLERPHFDGEDRASKTARVATTVFAVMIISVLLLCGGCVALFFVGLNSPPDTRVFEPFPVGTEVVSNRTFEERIDERPWRAREIVLRATDGRSRTDFLRAVSTEYQNYARHPIYQGVDGRLRIESVDGTDDQVRITYMISN